MLIVSGLYIYPVKSMAGIAVTSALLGRTGFQHDRRLMLVDSANRFLTQRELPEMALLQPALTNEGLFIRHKKNTTAPLLIPRLPASKETITVTVWDDDCEAQLHDAAINDWFSQCLGLACRLVYMPDATSRKADKQYAVNNEITSFADAYPILLIGQSSLDDLNERMAAPLPMNRFRPNIVFSGGAPFAEDQFAQFTINGIDFSAVKPCARCVITTIDQETVSQSKEPLKTLATYRLKNNKVLFGQNLLHTGNGCISTGDIIRVQTYQPAAIL